MFRYQKQIEKRNRKKKHKIWIRNKGKKTILACHSAAAHAKAMRASAMFDSLQERHRGSPASHHEPTTPGLVTGLYASMLGSQAPNGLLHGSAFKRKKWFNDQRKKYR